jgi:hypothetical protein
MGRGEKPIAVLNLVEVLDQKVATPRLIAEQSQDFRARLWVNRPPFGLRANLPALACWLSRLHYVEMLPSH